MRTALVIALALTLALPACQRTKAAPATHAGSASVVAKRSPAKIAKIVFIDKENACDCTRKRIAETWTAMQTALGTPATLPVERIHIDTQAAQAEVYTTFKPLMVPPGVYFVDQHDGIVEMLEGELKPAQIGAILKGR